MITAVWSLLQQLSESESSKGQPVAAFGEILPETAPALSDNFLVNLCPPVRIRRKVRWSQDSTARPPSLSLAITLRKSRLSGIAEHIMF